MAEVATTRQEGRGHGLLCPACKINLVMSERQGIEIDYCPECRGVWLERGELDKIIERSAGDEAKGYPPQRAPQGQPNPPQGYYEGGYGGHGGHHGGHGRRHGSFLGRLFD